MTKDWKRAPFGHIAYLHSLKMLPVYCGSISCDVVTAPTHCKSVRISFPSLSTCVLGWFVLCHWPLKTWERLSFYPFSSRLTLTLSIHIIYLCRPLECSRCLLSQGRSRRRGQDAVRYVILCFLFIGCHFCSACRLGSCMAIIGSDFRTLCSLSYPVWCIYECIYRLLPDSL